MYKDGKGFDPNVIRHVKLEYTKLIVEASCRSVFTVKRRKRMRTSTRLFESGLQKLWLLWYCGLTKLKLCVYDAISYFNYGALSIIDTLKLLGIDAGSYTVKSAVDANIQRRYNAGYKAKTTSMKRYWT